MDSLPDRSKMIQVSELIKKEARGHSFLKKVIGNDEYFKAAVYSEARIHFGLLQMVFIFFRTYSFHSSSKNKKQTNKTKNI